MPLVHFFCAWIPANRARKLDLYCYFVVVRVNYVICPEIYAGALSPQHVFMLALLSFFIFYVKSVCKMIRD